jgi:hypothetical protein
MKKTLITIALALGFGLVSAPSFAGSYVVNGHAATPAEAQLLVATGVQPGTWVVNGYGVSPAAQNANLSSVTERHGKQCWYVLDELLCD